MTKNTVQTIHDDSKKIYQTITSDAFLKWFYIIFLVGIAIMLIFIVTGLCIPVKPNGLILLIIGISISPVLFISFYVVEYLRRKAYNSYKQKFNFKELYGTYLYEQKLIDIPMELDGDFDSSFFRQHIEILSRKYEFVNLHKNYATYKFFKQQCLCHLSYCNADVVTKNSKMFNPNSGAFQLIIACDFHDLIEGILTPKDAYDVPQIDVWKKQVTEKYNIYSNNPINEWQKIINVADKLASLTSKFVEIKIKGTKVFYVIDFSESSLLLGLNNIKFYKTTWTEISDNYLKYQEIVKDIFSFILLQQ